MKTLELNTLPTPVLLVWGLPEDIEVANIEVRPFKILNDVFTDNSFAIFSGNTHLLSSPFKVKLIGKLSELTEDQARGLVHVSIHSGLSAHYTKGVNPSNVYCYHSSLKSFHSAIEAEGYLLVNQCSHPVDIMPLSSSLYEILSNKWQEAQSKTLPANTLIFKRI